MEKRACNIHIKERKVAMYSENEWRRVGGKA